MPRPLRISSWKQSRGQSVVEFALVLPILLILLAAAVDFGRLFYAYVAVENAAKEGALYGARSPLCDDNTNPVCADPDNVAWHVANEAPNLKDSLGNSLLSSTVACRDSAGALVQPINNCQDGYTYQVTVTYPFRLLTPILSTIMGQSFTLSSESQTTVISDAFDPSGIEALIWVDKTGADNALDITAKCVQADSLSSPGYYYQPCQDGVNLDNYMSFQENTTVNYKVRIKNTGNINLTGLTYAFSVNGTSVAKPGNCNTLPATMSSAAAPAYCSFSRPATATNPASGINSDTVIISVQGLAGGLTTGPTTGGATIKVAPAPHLAINLKASRYRLGGSGDGNNGTPLYATGGLTLSRNTASTLVEIQNPTGWFQLEVRNLGGAASNFSVGVTQAGAPVTLPGSCFVPPSLPAAGQPGDTFTCIFPRTFSTTQSFLLAATATATNSVVVPGQQPSVTVTTATCNGSSRPIPNLVDTLTPTADGTNKTVAQARTAWQAGFTGSFATVPAGAAGTLTVTDQSQAAYTCSNANTNVVVGAQ